MFWEEREAGSKRAKGSEIREKCGSFENVDHGRRVLHRRNQEKVSNIQGTKIQVPHRMFKESKVEQATHSECSADRIETHMHLVHKVCRVTDSHERTALVNVVLPPIELFVVLQRKEEPLVLCF